jgi:hypothetical protein
MRASWLLLPLCALALAAHAGPVALADDELASVSGGDGISLALHLQLDTTLTVGFRVDGTTTYAVLQGLGGTFDAYGLTLDVRQRPGGSDYLDIGLPQVVNFKAFGFAALGAQTDPQAPVPPSTSYGAIQLNGTAAMTGHLVLWAQ